jgi:Fur family transcriptional regulator, ferric uptake regulator
MTHCHTLLDHLRRRGYRITPQRATIIAALAHTHDHLTAEQVFGQVSDRSNAVNLATVYRTLDLLVDEGLANRIVLRGGQAVYSSDLHGPHLHLVCRRCGHTLAVEAEVLAPLTLALAQQHRFSLDLQHLSLGGVCQQCQTSVS